jgi:hypothetical protein
MPGKGGMALMAVWFMDEAWEVKRKPFFVFWR